MALEFDTPVATDAAVVDLLGKPLVQLGLCFLLVALVYGFIFLHNHSLGPIKHENDPAVADAPSSLYTTVATYLAFAWNCFFKPHGGRNSRNQQDALEGFYKAQASIYDATRTKLLRGREDMLGLVAAQLKHRITMGTLSARPVWVDMGGGTGYNIEAMARFVDVPNFFKEVYLVDFSPSLCAVAEDRFRRLGWKNVKVVCQDARYFRLDEHADGAAKRPGNAVVPFGDKSRGRQADVITMSYSLSMIPEYYSVVDSVSGLMSPNGVIGVADFYVQSEVDYQARNYTGGEIDRHCMWISRVFWRTWFEADRVGLEAARRDYLEYRFGTILSFNARCHMFGLRIPYYVWVGCAKESGSSQTRLVELNAAATESPFLGAIDLKTRAVEDARKASAIEIRSKAYESAIVNLAASLPLPASWYQAHHWRIYYDDSLPKHKQFKDEYIYAFTWEDARVDTRLLKINEDDVILAITSAGDNILQYALENPKRIHAVDLNPSQNHLLELKLAAYTALQYVDFWKLFGEGAHPEFRSLLIEKLSPHLSSNAFQFWLHNGAKTFSGKGFYYTGGSRHALSLVSWLFSVVGLKAQVARFVTAQTLNEQREIWTRSIRKVLLSRLLAWTVISNKTWLWRALGVPNNQREMIEQDYVRQSDARVEEKPLVDSHADAPVPKKSLAEDVSHYGSGRAIWEYAVNTLDPVVNTSLLSDSNHYYLVCLLGKYTQRCHPDYMSPRAHARLSRPGAFDGLRIHTDEVGEVVERMTPGTLTIAVIMDSMDWFNPGDGAAAAQIEKLRRALKMGGRVLLRSAGLKPWYVDVFENMGFACKRVGFRMPGECIDRVNMYASTWILTKVSEDGRTRIPTPPSPVSPVAHRRQFSTDLIPLSIGEASMEE